jgi:hypothetical protein
MNTLAKCLIGLSFCSLITPVIFAQDQQAPTEETTDKPVKNTFTTNMLIDNQTVMQPFKGSINFEIYHRFSNFSNGIKDLYGVFGSANTRLGLEYGITDRISVGVGTTKNYQLQDINWKLAILQQSQSGSMPVSLSYFGNMVIDAEDKSQFGPLAEYKVYHRLSYFTQLILARKFSKVFSFQVAPEFAYYNGVNNNYNNINLGLSLGGRAKILPSHAIIFEYDMPFFTNKTTSPDPASPKPNFGLGWEIGTGTHCFQIFVANYHDIIYQRNLVYNTQSGLNKNNLQIGFNITVRF